MEASLVWIEQIALWLSAGIFSKEMRKREDFSKKVIITIFIIALFSYISVGVILSQNEWSILSVRVINYILVGVTFFVCRKITVSTAIYYSIWSVMLRQIVSEINQILVGLVGALTKSDLGLIGQNIVMVLGYLGAYLIAALTIGKWLPRGNKERIGPRQLSAALLMFMIFEVITFSDFMSGEKLGREEWYIMFITQILCEVIMYLQSELFQKSAMQQELTLMNLLWKKEQEQYQLSKDNIMLINQKCHDLKHQIRALQNATKEEIDEYIAEIVENIDIYESIVKTGNEVLDTILTEKSLYCKEKGITISCVADGAQMHFINTVDLYAILGNAIDNAIEAVEKFTQKEKKQIDVLIYRQQNFLIINIINPIKDNLVFEEDFIPVTTKNDKKYHGYGLKSIKYIVKKYNGFFTVNEEDGCFAIKILVPIVENEKKM